MEMELDQSKSVASEQNLKEWGGFCLVEGRVGEVEGTAVPWEERDKCTKCTLMRDRERRRGGNRS